ncbi:MAG: cyclic nucleotide-binding domain-containing protein [Bacteroidota bacterium]
MTKELKTLHDFIQAAHPLPEEAWEALGSIWEVYRAERKEILTAVSQTERYLYFMVEGAQRIYFQAPTGKEATLIFTYAPSFGGVLDSFLLQSPSAYTYETLTASVLLRATHSQLQEVMESFPPVDAFVRQATHVAMAGLLERMAELQCYTSEEKFRALLRRNPHILQVIPQKYLANYLGVDPTNFSKFLNRIKI